MMPRKARGSQIRANTYWIGGDSGLGDPATHHNMRSGIPKGYTAGFQQIKKRDIPASIQVVDMPYLSNKATDDEELAHWDAFSDVIIAGGIVHLISARKANGKTGSRKGKSGGDCEYINGADAPDQPSSMLFLEQFLYPDVWDWSDTPDLYKALCDAISRRDVVAIGCLIIIRFERAGIRIKDFYIILHDRDKTDPEWDDAAQAYVRRNKGPHIHVCGHFIGQVTPNESSAALGIQPSQFELPKSKTWSFTNKMAYMVHFKDPHKFQYSPDTDVVTLVGASYQKYYREHKHTWEIGRAHKLAEIEEMTVDHDWLWEECFQGRVTRENIDLTDSYRRCYTKHKKSIDAALASYESYRTTRAVKDFDDGKFRTTFVYVQGPSRMGKSQITKAVVNALKARYRWTLDDLASSNAMDQYRGADIILIDDASASAMTGKAWLTLVDPNNAHPAPARYLNKERVAPRVVIITSTKDPIEFFFFASQLGGDRNEAMTQFIARIMTSIVVFDWRDMRDKYTFAALDGSLADPAMYNVQLLAPHMTDKPICHQLEVKSGSGNDHTETIRLNAELLPTVEDELDLYYTPIGAMWTLVQRIEQRNPDAVAYTDEADLKRAMGEMYLAAIAKDEEEYGVSNLYLQPNFEVLPDYIAEPVTPQGQAAADAARVKRLEEARLDAEAAAEPVRYASVHDLPDYDELAKDAREILRDEADLAAYPVRHVGTPENAEHSRLIAAAKEAEEQAEKKRKLASATVSMWKRLLEDTEIYFAMSVTDAAMKRVLRHAERRSRLLVVACRKTMKLDDHGWTFSGGSMRPNDYEVLSAFAAGYELAYGEYPFDVDDMGVIDDRVPPCVLEAQSREHAVEAKRLRAEAAAMWSVIDDDSIEPSESDVDAYIEEHNKDRLVRYRFDAMAAYLLETLGMHLIAA